MKYATTDIFPCQAFFVNLLLISDNFTLPEKMRDEVCEK
jgi:hypothetical protein